MAGRPRFATAWLGGCSGCHMSFLDTDEFLFELAERVDVVYSPLADVKEYPEGVDVVLVEGAAANVDNVGLAGLVRARSRLVVAFGDCAVTGNVTAMRNTLGDPQQLLRRVYVENVDRDGVVPHEVVPALLPRVLPLHRVIDVDIYLPGCPPPADRIRDALLAILAGELTAKTPARSRGDGIRFG